jgi:ELWxxDGT repeat protein
MLFFVANDGTNGRELWKSDSTAAGTVLVKDIWPGSISSSPSSLTSVNGTLFFSANDGVNGRELWKTDGTTAGTVLAADIVRGTGSSSPKSLANANGKLFFGATTPSTGYEPWMLPGSFVLGDMNDDGFVDGDDIEGFVLGIIDEVGYLSKYALPDYFSRGDTNGDGFLDGDDIESFVDLVLGNGPVPSAPVSAGAQPQGDAIYLPLDSTALASPATASALSVDSSTVSGNAAANLVSTSAAVSLSSTQIAIVRRAIDNSAADRQRIVHEDLFNRDLSNIFGHDLLNELV